MSAHSPLAVAFPPRSGTQKTFALRQRQPDLPDEVQSSHGFSEFDDFYWMVNILTGPQQSCLLSSQLKGKL
jgi:hypothetical protein